MNRSVLATRTASGSLEGHALSRHFLRVRGTAGDDRLIPLSAVVEVIPMVALCFTGGDEGNPAYCGLLQFRGHVMPVFDLDRRGMSQPNNPDSLLIVTRTAASEQAIMAAEVDDIIEALAADCSALDVGGPESMEVVHVDGTLVKVLDPGKLGQPRAW